MDAIRNAIDEFAIGFQAFSQVASQKYNFEVELDKVIEIN